MKKRQLLILSFLLPVFNFITAQSSCLPEGIFFSSQAQIDSFPIYYPGCTVIEGDVTIQEITVGDIVSLESLYPITVIEGNLEIGIFYIGPQQDGNDSLLTLDGFQNLDSIGGNLIVYVNDGLTSLSGFDNLTSIGGNLWVKSNSRLTSLSGLDNLTSIGGSLLVDDNDTLTSLSAFGNLTYIGMNLGVGGNNSLTDLSGLENITSISGSVSIGNWTQTSLSGLDNLTSIGGYLSVVFCPALTNLSGLDNLTSIGGRLSVGCNLGLTSLSGLENLTSIGGNLDFRYNALLTSLHGLDNLDYSGIDNIEISFNPNLSICDIQPICDYLENGGSATIKKNAPGCNSQQEVEAACGIVSVNDLILNEAINLFPNPTTGIVQIGTPENTEWEVSVRDAMGRVLVAPRPLENGQFDLSALPAGLYFVELNDGQHSIAKRIIRQ